MPLLRIQRPGMFTTVQDLGRPGWSAAGVPQGGAADTRSLRIGNRLVGNPDAAAVLEMTMVGASFTLDAPATIAITGGDCTCTIHTHDGQPRDLPMHQPVALLAGDTVSVGPITRGVRAYFCISGGLLVPAVMGSSSTHTAAGFGGLSGRALRAGDAIDIRPQRRSFSEASRSLNSVLTLQESQCFTLRAVPVSLAGPELQQIAEWFWQAEHLISTHSDRTGIRLGAPPFSIGGLSGRMVSEGMPPGAIQLPPGGEPIILGPDHPTTGGYPVIACIASVDLPLIGQLRPGERVRFTRVSQREALDAFRQSERLLDTVLPPV